MIRTDLPAVAPEMAATERVVGEHFCVEVGEDLLDHHGVLDTSDDPQLPAEGWTSLDVDAKTGFSRCALVIECGRSTGICFSQYNRPTASQV